jgi:hypothetical protein
MTHALKGMALAAVLVGAWGGAAPLGAQETKAVSVGLSGGISLPTQDLGDVTDPGFAVAGHLWVSPSGMRMVRFRGDLSYDRWGAKNASVAGQDVDWYGVGVAANALFHPGVEPEATFRPYLLLGAGLFSLKSTASGAKTESDFGVQGGGGLEFQLSGFSTFVEAKYVNSFASGTDRNWVPVTFGVRF